MRDVIQDECVRVLEECLAAAILPLRAHHPFRRSVSPCQVLRLPARSYGCFRGQASHLQTNPDQRYDTNIRGVGKNGFHLDSKEPDWSKFRDFIMGEVRYNSLMKTFPQEAEELFVATERNAKLRYEGYKKLSEM